MWKWILGVCHKGLNGWLAHVRKRVVNNWARLVRLFDELHVAHGDGSFARRLAQLAKLDVLVIDDFAISPMGLNEPIPSKR